MKRKIALLITFSLLLAGCNKAPTDSTTSADDPAASSTAASIAGTSQSSTAETGELHEEWMRIMVLNATETSNEVYYETEDFICGEDAVPGSDSTLIDKDKLDYIVSYIENAEDSCISTRETGDVLLKPEDYEGRTYLGSVTMIYISKDAEGNRLETEFIRLELFDDYPREYQEFIYVLNDVMSGEDLILGEPMEMSPDLYTRVTGYTDDMVTDGTIEEYLETYQYDVYQLMNYYSGNYSYFQNDYREIPEQFVNWPLFRVLPREIRSVESTDEEYREFAEELAVALGEDPSSVSENRYGFMFVGNQPFMVLRSCDMPAGYNYEGMPLYLVNREYLDGGELVRDTICSFFYSKDGKFIVMFNGSYIRSWYGEQLDYDYLLDFYQTCSDLLADG